MPNETHAIRTADAETADRAALSSSNEGEAVLAAWRIHPLRDNPRGIAPVAGAYALAFILWRVLFPHPLGLFLPVVALTGALSEYLFPTTYRLTTSGAHADGGGMSRLFIAWTDVRRATRGAEGVHLSPFSRTSRLDGFRGVRLKFTAGNADEIVEIVQAQRRIHAPAATALAATSAPVAAEAA